MCDRETKSAGEIDTTREKQRERESKKDRVTERHLVRKEEVKEE